MLTFRVLAALLHYPDESLQGHADELAAALQSEELIGGARLTAINGFIARLREQELLDLQSEYVDTFDRGRARSLYLYEHIHGESRDRGQAMVELAQVYRAHGFELATVELPDYLPLFLEFLASLPLEESMGWLEEVGAILQVLHTRLAERESPFSVLLEPLVRLAGLSIGSDEDRNQVAAEPPDDTPEALDKVWMETAVSFGPEGGCDSATGRSKQTSSDTQPVRWSETRSN